MSWATKYRVIADSFKEEEWWADIQEEDWAGGVVELKGTERPIVIKYIDNEEAKYPTIQSSFCTISFVSDTFDLESIISNDDKKYRVGIYRLGSLVWRGYLSTDDCSEEYSDGNRPFVLTATDGLGFLKEESYKWRTGETGIDAYGKRLLLDVLADCLHYTYTELDIYIQCNVYESTMTDTGTFNPFDQCKVHTKLFTYTPSGPSNMYETLETLMECFQSTLFQQGGLWIIRRKPDSFDNGSDTNKLYAWPDLTSTDVLKRWETDKDLYFTPINARHIRTFIKPTSSSIYTHEYLIPEIPINNDLSDGTRWPENDGASTRAYRIEFWSYENGNANAPNVLADQAYREEVLDVNDNITENYIVLPNDDDTNTLRLVNRDELEVDEGDEIEVSFETRLSADVGGTATGSALRIRLIGNSGQHWTYDGVTDNQWETTTDTGPGQIAANANYASGDDKTVWQALNVRTEPFPESGRLEIWLEQWDPNDNRDVYDRNIVITSYLFKDVDTVRFKGEQSTTILPITSRNKNEKTIRLGDSPKRVIASALWRGSDDTELTSGWGRVGEAQTERLININSQDLQKSTWRIFEKIDGDFLGVIGPNGIIGPANLFNLIPPDFRAYIATNLEIDVINDQWTGSLQEFRDRRTGGKDNGMTYYTETEFKYLFDERS